jgi:ferredoxin
MNPLEHGESLFLRADSGWLVVDGILMEEDERWCREEDERAIQQYEAMLHLRDCSACGQLYFPQFDGAQMCASCEEAAIYPSEIDSEDY